MSINKIDSSVVYTLTAPEQTMGVMPTNAEWRKLDLNSYSDAGSQYDSTAREVMDGDRQKRKGMHSGKTVTFGYNNDVTSTNVLGQVSSFLYGVPVERPTNKSVVAGTALTTKATVAITATTATSMTLASAVAGLVAGDLFVILDGQNDRVLLRVVSIAAAVVTFAVVDTDRAFRPVQTAQLARARFVKVGAEFVADAASLTVSGATAKVTLTGDAVFTGLGINVGEWVFVGGDAVANRFAATPAFYARVSNVAAKELTFDTTTSPIVADVGTGKSLHIYVGTFIRNGKTRSSYTHARYLGDDATGNKLVETFTGCMPSELGINLSESSIVNVDMTYLGLDHRASAMTASAFNTAFNKVIEITEQDAYHTASGMYRQRLAVHDVAVLNPAQLTSFVQEGSISITNNLSADTANGRLGAFDHSIGDFGVTGEVTAYFVSVEAVNAMRCNCTLGMDVILASKNTGQVIDMPSFTIGGGIEVEANTSIKLNLEQTAFKDSKYGFTLSWTSFSYLPDVAMPEGQGDCTC